MPDSAFPEQPASSRGAVAVDNRSGPFCNEADRAALEALYSSADGDGWTNSEGWLTDAAIGEWYGVTADSLGRVTEIDLPGNGLVGLVPPELGDLGRLTALRLGATALSGRLPQSLARVPLREFRYGGHRVVRPGGHGVSGMAFRHRATRRDRRGVRARVGPGRADGAV